MAQRFRSANRQTMREINQTLVLDALRGAGPISRTAIAEETRLSLATVSGITAELIDRGLVYERESGLSTGGRRPILLALNHGAGHVVGAKLTETRVIAALTDLGGEIVGHLEGPVGDDHTPAGVTAALAAVIDDLRAAHPARRVLGLGMGMAGVIDRRAGICRYSPFFGWRDVPLRRLLETRLGLPVVLENDVNALAVAERWFGSGIGETDFLVITLGRGVGLGIVINGQLYRGGCGGGGEFGHVTVAADGPACDCGKHGCLEALVADPALRRRLSTELGREITIAEGAALARGGDAAALAVFTAVGQTLGLAIAGLINVFNPPLLIVGGEGAIALDLLLPPLRQALEAHCFAGFFADVRLMVEPWGDDAWARGAASLMIEELFRPTVFLGDEVRASLTAPRGGTMMSPSR